MILGSLTWIFLYLSLKKRKILRDEPFPKENKITRFLNLGVRRHEGITREKHAILYWIIIIGDIFLGILFIFLAAILFFLDKFFW